MLRDREAARQDCATRCFLVCLGLILSKTQRNHSKSKFLNSNYLATAFIIHNKMFITTLNYIGSSSRSVLEEGASAIRNEGTDETELGAVPAVYKDSQSSYLQGVFETKPDTEIADVASEVDAHNFPVKKTNVNSSIGGRRGIYAKAHSNYLQQIYGSKAASE